MKQTYETGLEGESTAEAWLQEKRGMTTLERRFRSKHGEIDLVMEDGETIVFVEVKTRKTGAPGEGLLSVNVGKQRRIAQCATVYLMLHHMLNRAVRFDVIEIKPGNVTYIPNAFQPGGMFFQ